MQINHKMFLPAAIMTLAVLFFSISPEIHGDRSIRTLIDIGLAVNQSEVILILNGTETILDLSQSPPRTFFNSGDQDLFSCIGEIICINDVPLSAGPILIIPGTDLLNWNLRNYRGSFLIMAQNGKLNLINRLHLDEYLRGVLPKEVIAGWPMAVLKAQAIAARTYTLTSLQRHKENYFDLCPCDHCQVYGGASAEQPGTNQAVLETEGQVITYQGKMIDAIYHAASGGYTEDARNVWNSAESYLKPVIDWDQNSPYTQWTRIFSWAELQVMAQVAYPRTGRLSQLFPAAFDKDSRVTRLTLKGDLDEVSLTGVQFRSMTGIPSTNIQLGLIYGPEPYITLWWSNPKLLPYPEVLAAQNDIPGLAAEIINPPWDEPDPWIWLRDKEPVKLIVRGTGWGHGVGLSQWGAKGMADAGFDERRIIAHYYPGTVITSIDKL